ncbi:thioredoxin [Candidatus Gracilibacteria bacterium]|nr:thioredoxin [Candidatus Gracilibacteria bacterium]
MSHVIELNHQNFEKEVGTGITLVDFWAPWCGPCQMMLPHLTQFAEKGSVKVAKVNVDQNADLAQKFRIMGIPTLIVFKDGQIMTQTSGARTAEQLSELTEKYI